MKYLLILLLLPCWVMGQGENSSPTALTPTGVNRGYAPLVTVSNTSAAATSLLGNTKRDTIAAATLYNPTRPYHFTMWCTLTTPTLSIPTLTISIKVGNATLNVMSGVGLVGGLANTPFVIDFWLFPANSTTQYAFASVTQTGGTVANLNLGTSEQYAQWSLDPSQALVVDVQGTFGGATILGNATLTSRAFYKPAN